MDNAIKYAYQNPTLMGECIPKVNDVPTVKEVIEYSAKRAKKL